MFSKCCLLAMMVLSLATAAYAEEYVLWEYDLHSLPMGWETDPEWTFASEGAVIDVSYGGGSGGVGGEFGSHDTTVCVPAGTDSLIIHADQYLHLLGNQSFSFVEISISTDFGVNWSSVYYETSYHFTTDPLHVPVNSGFQSGDSLRIRFEAYALGTMYGGSSAYWRLEDFTLTAYGEDLALPAGSWAGIKTMFHPLPGESVPAVGLGR